jgi:hypothetical protein
MTTRDCIKTGGGKSVPAKIILGLAVAALYACFATALHADTVLRCYKGDKNNGQFVGEINMANLQNAGQECNTTYGDCDGLCYGCYNDNESTGEVCVDNQGNRFTR